MKSLKIINFIKSKKFALIGILIFFIIGFSLHQSSKSYSISLINTIQKKFQKILKSINYDDSYNKDNYEKYCPKIVFNVPKNSILVVGHAYGSYEKSSLRGDIGIAPKVYEFYLKNKKNIDAIIFSGDVLNEPSIKKWDNFYSLFNEQTKIYIAPGNHDVGPKHFDSALRDIFNIINHKNHISKTFPFKLTLNESLFIIGDSNSEVSSLDQIISILNKEEEQFKDVYVVMHHVFPEGLSDAANAPGRHKFVRDSFFKDKVINRKLQKIYFLYGDGGATKLKPRIKCIKLSNTFHMVSGIGELPGDTIYLINNNILYRMRI